MKFLCLWSWRFYSPKNVPMKEHERYQHTRLIAVYETEQIPNLPAEPMK